VETLGVGGRVLPYFLHQEKIAKGYYCDLTVSVFFSGARFVYQSENGQQAPR
jgi:hypothetical protein